MIVLRYTIEFSKAPRKTPKRNKCYIPLYC